MFFLRYLLLLVLLAPAAAAQPKPTYVRVPFNVSLWRGVSIGDAVVGGDTAKRVVHTFSLNLPYGEAAQLEGIAVGIFGTVYEEDVLGVQVAGFGNVAGESATGVQVAGLANVAGARMQGLQASGLANIAGDGGGGLQASGLANIAGESFLGVQTAGLANLSGEGFRGLQSAGLANIAGERTTGFQTAGLANIVGEEMEGFQAAGLANIAGEGVTGLQVAGLANIAGGTLRGAQIAVFNVVERSEGLQLGVVNVAGEQRGVPIGLYSRSGGVPVLLDVWADETGGLNVGVRSGSEVVSNYVGVSARPFVGAPYRWGVFAGIGVQQPLGARTTGGLDLLAHSLFAEDFGDWGGQLFRLRATVTQELSDRLGLFGGPVFSLFVSDDHDGDGLAPFSIYDREGGTFVRAWPGLEVGLRVRITR